MKENSPRSLAGPPSCEVTGARVWCTESLIGWGQGGTSRAERRLAELVAAVTARLPGRGSALEALGRGRLEMAEEGGGGERRGGEGAEAAAERGPGAAYQMFVTMEDLLEKLKLLDYEEEALRRHNMRPLSR